jgi:Ni,Fe-hydrogenase maturation factor
MTIYVFGNPDHPQDSIALTLAQKLQKDFPDTTFQTVNPNEDLPFVGADNVIILDAVAGIKKVTLIQDKDLEKLILPPRNTAHDFGLGFQLKYLKKLRKLGKVSIIGLPIRGSYSKEEVIKLIKEVYNSHSTN